MKIDNSVEKAEALRLKGYFKESLKLWNKIYKRTVKDNDIDTTVDCLIVIGDLYRILGSFKKAQSQYYETIEVSNVLRNDLAKADALVGLSLSKKSVGQWKEALELIKKARKIYEKNKDKKAIAFTFWAEGGVWRVAGRIKKSLKSFYKAQKEFKKLKNKQALGYVYCGIGGSSRVYGDYQNSMKYYRMANKIFKKIKDRFGLAYSFCGIGNAHRMMNELENAEKNFKTALKIYGKIGDTVSSSYTMWSMAMIKILNRNFNSSLEYIKKAEKNFLKCNDPRGLIYCKLLRGVIHYLSKRKKFAKKCFLDCLNVARSYDFALEKKYAYNFLEGKYSVYNIP